MLAVDRVDQLAEHGAPASCAGVVGSISASARLARRIRPRSSPKVPSRATATRASWESEATWPPSAIVARTTTQESPTGGDRARVDQAALAGDGDELGLRARADGLRRVAQMGANGARGDPQLVGDLVCAQSQRHPAEDLELARRERTREPSCSTSGNGPWTSASSAT
jgi:hypothetical protein